MKFLSVTEVSEIEQVTRTTVINWIRRGLIPAQRMGYVYIIPENYTDTFERPKQGNPTWGQPKKEQAAA